MIAHLLGALRTALEKGASPEELDRHLEGIAAIMESHFRYEERQLLTVLETLELDAHPRRRVGSAVTLRRLLRLFTSGARATACRSTGRT